MAPPVRTFGHHRLRRVFQFAQPVQLIIKAPGDLELGIFNALSNNRQKLAWTTGANGWISVPAADYSTKTVLAMRTTPSKPSSIFATLPKTPLLHRKADMFLDLVFADVAEETLGSVRDGPKTRTKEEGFEARYYGSLFAHGERFRESESYLLPPSSYYPSPAIVSLGEDASSRGAHSWSKRCSGFKKPRRPTDPPKWNIFDSTNSIIRNGLATQKNLWALTEST